MTKKVFIKTVLFALLVSTYSACNGQTVKPIAKDAVALHFGDTVATVLASPSKVRAYILTMEKPTQKSRTVGGFTIKKNLGNVSATAYSILQFLLQDAANYAPDSVGVHKCYFEPYLAFEFAKGREKVCVLLAFNCECWGVVYNDKRIEAPYLCHRQLLRFAHGLLPDDRYINKLLTFMEDEK
ncbi:MAG: hypothetical protein LBC98_09750 [Prevotellaceae bacterium]|jgi:hypothetical protein|nr:hypothetical protein [Prevotellaceae bacterium]